MKSPSASLPAPDSPVMSTFASVVATRSAKFTAARITSDNAIISFTILLSKNLLSFRSRILRSNLVRRDVVTLRLAPEPLKIVKPSRLLVEHVHHEIAVIDQNPFGGLIALNARGRRPAMFKLLDNLVANGLDLPPICAGKDHEKIGKGSDTPQIEHRGLESLLLSRSVQH